MMIQFIVIHLVLSFSMAFMGFHKINKQERFCNFALSLFFPIGGYCTVLILYLLRNRSIKEIDEDEEEKNIQILFTDRFDLERDTNIVPLEEALLINDTKIKRYQLLDAMKRDSSGYKDMLKIALRDEDVETAHYAASAVDKIKREFDLRLQKISIEYQKNKQDEKLLKEYGDVLEEYLDSHLLDEYEYKINIEIYIEVLENLLKIKEDNEEIYRKLIYALFKIKDLGRAERYCNDFMRKYKNEEAYMVNLQYYYLMKDKNNFDRVFKELLKSPIKISNKALGVVRFWLQEV